MALDASINRNFNTRNPKEAVKVIKNLASSSSTKNTDFERKRSASILGNDQMDEVKAKLDSVPGFSGSRSAWLRMQRL